MHKSDKQAKSVNKEGASAEADGRARLLTPLPEGDFVDKPEEIDRFIVRIWPDGTIYFKGNRPRIDEFLSLCDEYGLALQVDHISLCG